MADEYSNEGNRAGATIDNNTGEVLPTIDPDIVKQRKVDETRPDWAMANDTEYWYGPTSEALLRGKVVAAVETLSEVPDRIYSAVSDAYETAKENLPTIGKWLIIGLVAYAVIKSMDHLPKAE